MGHRFFFVAFSVCAAGPAWAACPASNQFTYVFNAQAATSLNYANSYSYTATNGLGQTMTFTVSFSTNGLSSNAAGGVNLPAINSLVNNDGSSRFLVVGGIFTGRSNTAFTTRYVATTFTFPSAVRDVTVTASDIDYTSNQFRDWLQVTASNGASSYTPALTTPFGQANVSGPFTNGSSTLTLGPATTPGTVSATQAVGTGSAPNTDNTGDVITTVAQPITALELRYGNYPLTGSESSTGQQAIGFKGVSFCPMPVITVAKTSAPWTDPVNGTANPKLIPGADVLYTLTVSNANTSPVDPSATVVTDPLPPGVTFYNGDIDDGGPLTTNYQFDAGTSGLSFSAANLTYSNNGGASYAYAPVAGYDANVNALRFAPTGSMAANSSFTLKFRARIN